MNRGLVGGLFHRARRHAPAGRHGVRHVLRGGVELHARPGRRRRPRGRRSFRPRDLVGRRPRRHQPAFLLAGRACARNRAACRSSSSIRARTRSAKAADLYLPIRIGTDAALALGVMHILVRDKLVDRDYIASQTLGFDKVERDILPKFPPNKVAEITGLPVADIEKFAAMYGKAKAAMIRLGEGMTRLAARRPGAAHGGAAAGRDRPLRREGRRRHAAHRGVVRPQLCRRAQAVGRRRAGGPHRQSSAPRRRAPQHEGPADPRALHLGQQPGRDLPRSPQGAEGPLARGPVHRRARPVHDRHGEVRRHRAAGDDLSRDRRPLPCLRRLLDAVGPSGGEARGRGALQLRRGAGAGAAHGPYRQHLHARAAGGREGAVQGLDRSRLQGRSGKAVRGRADPHQARLGRPAVQHAVGQARVLFRAARQDGRVADAGLGARSRSTRQRRRSGRCGC